MSKNEMNETLLLSGKKIYTFVNQVTNVYTCSLCNDIRDVAMIADTMYIACDGSGIVKKFGDSTKVVTALRSDRLVSGNGGKLYGVDWMDGLDYWDGSTWQNLTTSNSSIPTNDIYDVILDHNGLLWIASQIGLISWDGTTFSKKSVPADLSASFYDVNVDSSNAIWVASAFGGVGKYSGGTWTTFSSTFNALERVENLAILNGSEIWTSETSLGFYRFTGTFSTVPFSSLGATE
ncbi:MAG TPA: two-component regulator propeller domain-containing protein, partial [Saprospiraceae bacterium]|nr:two-component regulator propeller domain-containing protein [Saprospiraceae bacterium]